MRVVPGSLSRPRLAAIVSAAVIAGATLTHARGAQQTPAPQASAEQVPRFRAGVSLVAVDVQVVDRDGSPVRTLGPDSFEVSIAGKRRRVASVNFIEQAAPVGDVVASAPGPTAANIWPVSSPGRVYVLAIDTDSFGVTASRNMIAAAEGFVERLAPADYIGLDAYPLGPIVNPTQDRGVVSQALNKVVGHMRPPISRYHLSTSDVVDITGDPMYVQMSAASQQSPPVRSGTSVVDVGQSDTIKGIQLREGCYQPRCVSLIQEEADSIAYDLESHVAKNVDGLHSLFRALETSSMRKIVILFSAGVVTSDRPGGRPDSGGQEQSLGQEVARARSTVYTLHLDTSLVDASTADTQRGSPTAIDRDRDEDMLGRWLEWFAGSSGGTFLRVLAGSGESSLDRVLRETSGYYLLGVEPTASDEDGSTRQLSVKVHEHGMTVRSRSWVALPKRS